MNYISAEEFLKQDDKVQNVLLDWWKPQKGDLLKFKYSSILLEIVIKEIDGFIYYRGGGMMAREIKDCIPLLQMHQLINFIEDKTNGKLDIDYYYDSGYELRVFDSNANQICNKIDIKVDLLQALWKVAIQIAKESV